MKVKFKILNQSEKSWVLGGKEKAITVKFVYEEDNEKLKQMYTKVVVPNRSQVHKGFIRCPACGEEILITPTLKKMNEAIENHVQYHKNELESNLLLKYTKPINIRLALVKQILHKL